MNPKVSNVVFVLLEVLAIGVTVYAISNVRAILQGISADQAAIDLDTGVFYFLMMLILPWLHLVGWISKTHVAVKRRFGHLMYGTFGFLILAGWGSGQLLRVQLENAGYQACPRMRLHRVGAGKHLVYRTDLSQCAVPEHEPIWE